MQQLFLSFDFIGSVEETTVWSTVGGRLSGGWKNKLESQSFVSSFSLLAFLVCQTGKYIFGPVLDRDFQWLYQQTFVKC